MNTFIHPFTHLNTATNRTHWTAATRHRAPNKPLLLLTVIDLFAQGTITANLIEPTDDLVDLFALYWSLAMPLDRRSNLAMPFFHLRAEGFWQLVPRPGQEAALAAVKSMSSMAQVHELLLGAQLDPELFALLQQPAARDHLRAALIATYFAPELHAALYAQAVTNQAAFQYSLDLVEEAKRGQALQEALIPYATIPTPIRDQGFRRAVVNAYAHRCAFCARKIFHGACAPLTVTPRSMLRTSFPGRSATTTTRAMACPSVNFAIGLLMRGCWAFRRVIKSLHPRHSPRTTTSPVTCSPCTSARWSRRQRPRSGRIETRCAGIGRRRCAVE